MKQRVVIITFGSLGDLHPYLAIALALRERGHEVIVGTGECYREKVQSLGLGFRPVRPDSDMVVDPATLERYIHPRWGLSRVIREHLLPALRDSYADTLAAVQRADLLITNQAMYASRLVAEQTGLPWISAMHVPLGIFSAYDPPLLPGFVSLSRLLRPLGFAFWKRFGPLVNWLTASWAKPLVRFRSELGLKPGPELNPLVEGYSPRLHLLLFSPQLAAKQPDWPAQTVVTGFPWFERDAPDPLPEPLVRFLDQAGREPIVFTLGSAVSQYGGARKFFETCVHAARSLDRPAVLVLGKNADPWHDKLPSSVLAIEYASYLKLFPRAATVVHHGGIGTTGLGMRSGRPMLIVPWSWDQPDNAARAARLGIARVLDAAQYTPDRVRFELRQLLDSPDYRRRAEQVGQILQQEDGVQVACDAVESLELETRHK